VGISITALKKGSLPVDLSSAYNAHGIYTDGSTFPSSASLDGEGFAYSAQALGNSQFWNGVSFKLGPANAPDAVTSKTAALPAGKFASLNILATGVEGSQDSQVFTVTYDDGTGATFTQSLSDWYVPSNFPGESAAVAMPYRLASNGQKDDRTFYLYAYSFDLDRSKVVHSLTLPDNESTLVFAISLEPSSP
jgi:hypothetical protein